MNDMRLKIVSQENTTTKQPLKISHKINVPILDIIFLHFQLFCRNERIEHEIKKTNSHQKCLSYNKTQSCILLLNDCIFSFDCKRHIQLIAAQTKNK